MNPNLLIAGTVIAALVIVLCIVFAISWARKHKIDVAKVIDNANAEVPVLTQVVNILEVMLPAEFKAAAALIGGILIKGITVAENLKDAGNITADQRKSTALDLISSGLKLEGITPSDKATAVIDKVVDIGATVLVPHQSEKTAVLQSIAKDENVTAPVNGNDQKVDTPKEDTSNPVSADSTQSATPQAAAAPQNITNITVTVPTNATAEQISAAIQTAQAGTAQA